MNLLRTVGSCFKRKEVGSRPEGGCWWNVLDFHVFCLWSLNNFYMCKLLCALDAYRNGWYTCISQIQQASTLLKCSVPGAGPFGLASPLGAMCHQVIPRQILRENRVWSQLERECTASWHGSRTSKQYREEFEHPLFKCLEAVFCKKCHENG